MPEERHDAMARDRAEQQAVLECMAQQRAARLALEADKEGERGSVGNKEAAK